MYTRLRELNHAATGSQNVESRNLANRRFQFPSKPTCCQTEVSLTVLSDWPANRVDCWAVWPSKRRHLLENDSSRCLCLYISPFRSLQYDTGRGIWTIILDPDLRVQSDPLNDSTVLSNKNWTNNRIEPLSHSGLLREHYRMGLAKSWTINQIEPLSGDPLSGLDCNITQIYLPS